MNVSFKAAFQSCLATVLVFFIANTIVEYFCTLYTGISVVHSLEQKTNIHYGSKFYLLEIVLFFCETYLVLIFYGFISPKFASTIKPAVITIIFTLLGIAFFLGHAVNLGIYPMKIALVFLLITTCAYSPSIIIGAFYYDTLCKKSNAKNTDSL
jgi:hypothetical protein